MVRIGSASKLFLFMVVLAGCSSGPSDSGVLVRIVGTVASSEGGPIVGSRVALANGGDSCIPLLHDLPSTSRVPTQPRLALASLMPRLPSRPSVRRFGCIQVGIDQTDGEGRFAIEYQTAGGGEDCSSLVMDVSADGFIGRYTSPGEISCSRTEQTFDFGLTPGTVPFSVIQPLGGATIAQNDASSGCPGHPTRGGGYRILFDWSDATLSGPDSYRIRLMNPGLVTVWDLVLSASEYSYRPCDFVPDGQLGPWQWRVRYEGRGQVSDWSEYRFFSFGPCRTEEGACF